MDVVRNASGSQDGDVVVSSDAREIFAERGDQFFGDEVFSVFGAKDTMNEDVGISVGHGDDGARL